MPSPSSSRLATVIVVFSSFDAVAVVFWTQHFAVVSLASTATKVRFSAKRSRPKRTSTSRNEREREVGETEAASWEGKGKDGQKTLLTSLKTSRIIIDLGHGHYSLATSANRYYYMCLNDLLAGVGNAGVGVLDAICMESKWKLYLGNSTIMYPGDLIEMIVFIVHGKLEIKDSSGTSGHISDGDACCQGLLFWYLQRALSNSNTDGDKLFFPEERFLSTKSITCLTDVEVFVVEVTDLEKILTRFTKFLHTPRIEEAIKRHKMLERLHEESGSHFD